MKNHTNYYVKNIVKMLESEYFNFTEIQDKLKIRNLNSMYDILVKVYNNVDIPENIDITLLIRLHDLILVNIEIKKENEKIQNLLDKACY